MSASIYNNPYAYKPPPVRINYPPLFICFNDLTFRYVLDSKIMAIGVLVCGVATLFIFGMIVCPFWFTLTLSPSEGTFGSEPLRESTKIDAGIFYLRAKKFDNTVFLDKFTNADAVPNVIQGAQVFSIFSMCVMVGCVGASVILLLRRFSSPTALMMLAGANTIAGFLQILMIFCCVALVVMSDCAYGDGCDYSENEAWRNVPIYSQFYRIEPKITPKVELNWAFYMACIAAIACIASAVIFWIETFMTTSSVRKIRYQQLKQKRDPHEDDINPYSGHKYVYQPPVQSGPNMYGMQPVMAVHPYEGVVVRPGPSPGYLPPVGFVQEPVGYYNPPPEYNGRQGPPSSVSFSSAGGDHGPVVSREIDL